MWTRVFLLLLLVPAALWAESPSQPGVSVTFAWEAPTTGTPTGYKLHWGPEPGRYTTVRDVGSVTQATLEHLPPGQTVYVAATAYDAREESGYSNEVMVTPEIRVRIGPPGSFTVQPAGDATAAPVGKRKGK